MASTKERQKWDRMWTNAMTRLKRQHAAITRLLAANTAMSAALFEIADTNCDGSSCVERAKRAIEEAAAASREVEPESFEEPTGEGDTGE